MKQILLFLSLLFLSSCVEKSENEFFYIRGKSLWQFPWELFEYNGVIYDERFYDGHRNYEYVYPKSHPDIKIKKSLIINQDRNIYLYNDSLIFSYSTHYEINDYYCKSDQYIKYMYIKYKNDSIKQFIPKNGISQYIILSINDIKETKKVRFVLSEVVVDVNNIYNMNILNAIEKVKTMNNLKKEKFIKDSIENKLKDSINLIKLKNNLYEF